MQLNSICHRLERVHDDSFALIHMTGMRQPKNVYISSILDGTLNYYSAAHEDVQVKITGDIAQLIGKSRMSAYAVGIGNGFFSPNDVRRLENMYLISHDMGGDDYYQRQLQ